MINILVTGANGVIGTELVETLSKNNNYKITITDLYNKHTKKVLKKYKKKSNVNIIYGDITDRKLVEKLVKDQNYIIHLAAFTPIITTLNKDLAKSVDYESSENFIRAMNYYNPNATFIYASTTSLYDKSQENITTNSKISYGKENYYLTYKEKTEELIKSKLNKYTIVRIPLVLSKLTEESFIYNIDKKDTIACITKEDAASCFSKIIEKSSKVNNKLINVSSSNEFNMTYLQLLNLLANNNTFSYKLILSDIFLEKNYSSPVCTDVDKYNKILSYQNDKLENYLNRMKYSNKARIFSKYTGRTYLKLWQKKK